MRSHILRNILREIGGKDLYIELRNGTRFSGVSAVQLSDPEGAVMIGEMALRPDEAICIDGEDIVLVKRVHGAG